MHEYVISFHVHSHYSDGSGTIEEIAEAAKKANSDIVIINDHHTLKALKNGEEGYYDDVLMLIGTEINKKYNHYLAMGVTKEVAENTTEPQKVIDDVKKQGGVGFIAHPFEKGSPLFFKGHVYTWNDWNVEGYDGICVWNYCAQWRDGASTILKTLYSTFINPNMAIDGPCPEALAKVDMVGQNRKIALIGGTDAHAVKIKLGPLIKTVFPYEYLFKTVTTHILLPKPLTEDVEKDKENVYKALAAGHSFVSFDYYQPANGFRMYLCQGEETIALMGDEVLYQQGFKLNCQLPAGGRIKLYRDGKVVTEAYSSELTAPIEKPGVYRVEAYLPVKKRFRPWIFSNPIFVR